MKKNTVLVLMVLTVLISGLVSADLGVEESDLTINVNYEELDGSDNEVDVNHQVTITNNGDSTENLTISLEDLDSGYDLIVSPTTLEIEAGNSAEVTISGEIPADEDQGEHQFGELKVAGGSEGDQTFNLKTDVQSMVEIKKIYVYADGYKLETISDDDEEVEDLKPGDEVELKFHVRNLFDEDYNDGDLSGTITVQLDESDFGDEVDEEEDFDVDAGEDSEEIVISFSIPDDVDEDEYTFEITVEAEDENNAEYWVEWELTLDVKKEDDDLRINKLLLSPEEITCSGSSQLTAEIKNFGGDRQKYTVLKLYNVDLGIDESYNYDLGQDDEETKTININVKEKHAPGTYPIVATVYYDYNTFGDEKVVELTVKGCPLEEEEEEVVEEETDDSLTGGSVATDIVEEVSSSNVVKTVEDSYSREDFLIAALLISIIAIFALIVLLFVAFFKK